MAIAQMIKGFRIHPFSAEFYWKEKYISVCVLFVWTTSSQPNNVPSSPCWFLSVLFRRAHVQHRQWPQRSASLPSLWALHHHFQHLRPHATFQWDKCSKDSRREERLWWNILQPHLLLHCSGNLRCAGKLQYVTYCLYVFIVFIYLLLFVCLCIYFIKGPWLR